MQEKQKSGSSVAHKEEERGEIGGRTKENQTSSNENKSDHKDSMIETIKKELLKISLPESNKEILEKVQSDDPNIDSKQILTALEDNYGFLRKHQNLVGAFENFKQTLHELLNYEFLLKYNIGNNISCFDVLVFDNYWDENMVKILKRLIEECKEYDKFNNVTFGKEWINTQQIPKDHPLSSLLQEWAKNSPDKNFYWIDQILKNLQYSTYTNVCKEVISQWCHKQREIVKLKVGDIVCCLNDYLFDVELEKRSFDDIIKNTEPYEFHKFMNESDWKPLSSFHEAVKKVEQGTPTIITKIIRLDLNNNFMSDKSVKLVQNVDDDADYHSGLSYSLTVITMSQVYKFVARNKWDYFVKLYLESKGIRHQATV